LDPTYQPDNGEAMDSDASITKMTFCLIDSEVVTDTDTSEPEEGSTELAVHAGEKQKVRAVVEDLEDISNHLERHTTISAHMFVSTGHVSVSSSLIS
jgi:hypothetical protein